ncbi:hypothetical protein JL720_11742 [Aureococcus anophagefferens]|nr:hypothetical protein JL720_11742 [Aureococcus anophagefferens]
MHVALLVALALPQRTLPLSVGIDLGTSNSCVAWTRADGTRELVPRRDGGGLLTPSVCVVDGAAPRSAPDAAAGAGIIRAWKRAVGLDAATANEATESGGGARLSKVQTANEPELAAHAHGVGAGGGDALALVFDLGGGTLDCSLVDVGGETRTMEVVATAGDLNLGGTDFTAALARAENIDEAEAERVKIALTTRKVAATAAGANVTRSRLEACLDPLLERCADAAREAAYLGDARLKGDAEPACSAAYGGAADDDDDDGDDDVVEVDDAEFALLALAEADDDETAVSSNLDVDVAQLDKDQPFYFPEEYKYSGAVFCYDTELWRPKQSDSRDVFSSMGPQNPTRDPHDPVIHEGDDEA